MSTLVSILVSILVTRLYRHPDTKGRFLLLGPNSPPLRRADWVRYLGDAGWILVTVSNFE
eukprot:SAG11_NODE_21100_length_432_cov_0.927928_1_plen_59_part_10